MVKWLFVEWLCSGAPPLRLHYQPYALLPGPCLRSCPLTSWSSLYLAFSMYWPLHLVSVLTILIFYSISTAAETLYSMFDTLQLSRASLGCASSITPFLLYSRPPKENSVRVVVEDATSSRNGKEQQIVRREEEVKKRNRKRNPRC